MKIPLSDVAEGADRCLENSLQFCCDAQILCDVKSFDHAWAFCVYALEELGKAILLKSKFAYAQKASEECIVLGKEKPEKSFRSSIQELREKGFRWNKKKKELQEVNFFYDHRSKLLIASDTNFMATHENVMKSLKNRVFQSRGEIKKVVTELLKEKYDVNVYNTEQRESALYVDYDQNERAWVKGRPEITEKKLRALIVNIENAVKLNRQWVLPSIPKSSDDG